MSARIATGLARTDAGVDPFAVAAARAALQLGGAPADLAVVFAGAANLGHAEQGLAAVQDLARLGAISAGRHARGAAGEPVAQRLWHRLPWLLVGVLGAVAATRPLAALDGPAPGTAPL